MAGEKQFCRSLSDGYGENYGKDNKDKEISDFCENISILDCPGFVNSELRANAKSIRQCLEGLSDSHLINDNNNSKKAGITREFHTEINHEASALLKQFRNCKTSCDFCYKIYRKKLWAVLENICKKLLSVIVHMIESRYRKQDALRKIIIWNKLFNINRNYKAFSVAIQQCHNKRLGKGFANLRKKQKTTQKTLCKSKGNFETSFVRISQKLDHMQHLQMLKRLSTGYLEKKVIAPVPFSVDIIMPVQNKISLDNPSRRLLTFSDWPIRTNVWPQQLSNAGFYYTREGTTVRCATCGVKTVVDGWQRLEKPEVVHFKLNNNCEFIKGYFPYLKDVTKDHNSSSICNGDSVKHETVLTPLMYDERVERGEKQHTERHCNNVTVSSTGNSNVCVSDTTFKGLKVNDSLIRDKTPSECNNLNENSQLGLSTKTLMPVPSLMKNCNTDTIIWSGSSASNHISNTSLNNGASGSSNTHVDTNKGSNTSMPMPNKDQLYISGSSQDNYTQNLQNNKCLVSNSMAKTENATSNPQTLLNTQFESTIGRHIYSQSINMDATVSSNQLERMTPHGQASLSPVHGHEAPSNYIANRPTSFNSKLQLPFKRSAYNNSIDIIVPVSANQSEREQTVYEPEFSHPNFRRFEDRMESYKKWPIAAKQPPNLLAESGCFYTGKDDIVRCFSCNLGLAEWAETDDPWTEHARHNPKCWFLRQEKGQPFIDMIQGEWQKRYKPKNPAFDDVLSRLATFDGWREDIEQTPEDLADAGFFSTGEDDIVRCHYCDGGLRNWESGDVPWEEHARWFPHCKYLIKMKGMQFIDSIKEKYQRHEASINTTNTTEEQGDNQLLATENAKTVLKMGFPVNTVKSAINSLIRTRGHRNFSTEDLLEFILNPVESSQTPTKTSNEASGQATRPFPDERDPAKLKVINTELKNNLLCVICRKNERCMLFANCGHRVTCEQCCRSIDFCPHCDKRIKKTVKTYMS